MSVHCPGMGAGSRSQRVEIRIGDDERQIDEAAAAALGISLSEFFRQAARARAQEVLRERGQIALGDDSARAFLAALDADAPPPPEMRDLFSRNVPWAS